MQLIGIFQGKQAKHNIQILNILYDNGPLTAWEITGKIQNRGRISLHATLNKRLRKLEEKGYVKRAAKKWCLQFKGIIAAVLMQKKPRPLSSKWADLIDSYEKYLGKHFSALSNVTIQANGATLHPLELINKTVKELRTFNDWILLSNYVKGLIQTGVVNFDVISNETLFTVILSEFSHEQVEATMKDWNIRLSDSTSDNGKTEGN
jgi:DNA-binding Lrp family transcriptional regulator